LKDPRASFKQVHYIEPYLWIRKNTGIRNFMDRLYILSTYLHLFPPLKGEIIKELSDLKKATILYDALPHYYIKKMEEDNTDPIEMSLDGLFQFTLNIDETEINPGKDSEGNARSRKYTKIKTAIPQKQVGGKGKHQKKSGSKSSIVKGQDVPSCIFCGRKGHTETACHIQAKAMTSAKKETKDRRAQWKKDKAEKSQSFAASASASAYKQGESSEEEEEEEEDDKDKKAFIKSFMASWKTSQKDKKSQKNKRKRSDNDSRKYEQNYPQYFILVALETKGAHIGIPTTEVIGETTVNGSNKPLRIIIDTVKLIPLPQPHLRMCTYAQTYPSAQRATHLKSVLAHVYSVSIQNLNTTTVP
jgi:hypothetical protein